MNKDFSDYQTLKNRVSIGAYSAQTAALDTCFKLMDLLIAIRTFAMSRLAGSARRLKSHLFEQKDKPRVEDNPEPKSLQEVLDRIAQAAANEKLVSLREIVTTLGPRAFGPWLVLVGLITLSPVGDIPGTPTLMALLVLLISGQLFFHRDRFWLPSWMLKRSVSHHKLDTGVKWMRRPAGYVDGILRPRIVVLTGRFGGYLIAAMCIVIALAMPAMELVPFSATGAGIALAAFGLALITNDGLVALLALGFTAATIGMVAYSLL